MNPLEFSSPTEEEWLDSLPAAAQLRHFQVLETQLIAEFRREAKTATRANGGFDRIDRIEDDQHHVAAQIARLSGLAQ